MVKSILYSYGPMTLQKLKSNTRLTWGVVAAAGYEWNPWFVCSLWDLPNVNCYLNKGC